MIGLARLKPAAGYIGFGIVLYLLFLVATAPAIWFADFATRVSAGTVTLTQARGTLWHGVAQLHAGAPAGVRDLGKFQWRIAPWWLALGRAQLAVELEGPSIRGQARVRIARHRVDVDGLQATLPANLVTLVYGPAAFFEPTGTIELRSSKIELSGTGLITKLEAQWLGAGGRFTGAASLGDYRIEVTGNGENAAIRLTTLRGNLELSGQGEWHVVGDGAVRFTGSAVPRGDVTQLEPLLRALGRDLGGGRRQIRFSTRIPLIQQLGL